MIDVLREWLLGITGAAMILALADSLMPDGTVKKVGKLAGGLLLIVVTLRPVLGLDYEAMAATLANYRFETEEYNNSLEIENDRLKKIIIEDRTGAYIQDKAAELGIHCSVDVTCHIDEEGMIYPKSVVICGELTPDEMEDLAHLIEGEVAIPMENQKYERISDNEGEGRIPN